jgi:hypothetical protein
VINPESRRFVFKISLFQHRETEDTEIHRENHLNPSKAPNPNEQNGYCETLQNLCDPPLENNSAAFGRHNSKLCIISTPSLSF